MTDEQKQVARKKHAELVHRRRQQKTEEEKQVERKRDRKRKRKKREEIKKMRAQREAGIMERATQRVVSGQSRQTRDQQMCAATSPQDDSWIGKGYET